MFYWDTSDPPWGSECKLNITDVLLICKSLYLATPAGEQRELSDTFDKTITRFKYNLQTAKYH